MDPQEGEFECVGVEAVRPRDTVEIRLSWGGNALRVAHVPLTGRFVLGESSDADFTVGRDVLGVPRLVLLDGGNVSIPKRSGGSFRAQPLDACVEFERGALSVVARRVRAGTPLAHIAIEARPYAYVGGAIAFAGVVLLGASLVPPSNAALSIDKLDLESRLVSTLLEAETVPAFEEPLAVAATAGLDSSRDLFDPGLAGRQEVARTQDRQGVRGPRDNERVELPREHAEPTEHAGALGVLHALSGAWNAPTSPFSRESALGHDAMNALGSLTGDRVGDSFGFGSLGLSSAGRGGGGDGGGVVEIGRGGFGSGSVCGCGEMGTIVSGMGHGEIRVRASSSVPEPMLDLADASHAFPAFVAAAAGSNTSAHYRRT